MKIALSRYRNKATLGGTKYVELPNGFSTKKFINKFSFIYANVSQSLTAQITNLGSNENDTKIICTLDSRFKPLVDHVNGDQVGIHGRNYRITNVTIDDTDVMPVYRVTISSKDGFSNGGD